MFTIIIAQKRSFNIIRLCFGWKIVYKTNVSVQNVNANKAICQTSNVPNFNVFFFKFNIFSNIHSSILGSKQANVNLYNNINN